MAEQSRSLDKLEVIKQIVDEMPGKDLHSLSITWEFGKDTGCELVPVLEVTYYPSTPDKE